ncbi:hypothetical protein [Marinilabilia sp.]|uniref:hypothetical protein n=1 Tax=Marinilabilia sp. TaxID=2021252 RepID=UPI0025C0FA83|nr:hypothetical protein [Marinilabilia sp.]
MEKDALLEIIIHDLKEVEIMAENAKGERQLSKAYFKLTRNRIKSILEEIEMLEELSLPDNNESQSGKSVDPEKPTTNPEIDHGKEAIESNSTPTSAATEEPVQENFSEEGPVIEEKDAHVAENSSANQLPQKTPEAENLKEKIPAKEKHKEATQEPKTAYQEEKKKESKVLGEKLKKEQASFNEQIGKHQKTNTPKHSFSTPPIADLKKAMGINDRFFFQRELFNGSADVMNQTLEQLNQMQGINEAQNFLLANFNWDPENEAVLSFMELVERRYY